MAVKKESAALRFFYGTAPGRLLLRPLLGRGFSRFAGHLMDSRLSRRLISPFVRKKGIVLSDFTRSDFDSFNDFFTREIRPELRPIDSDPGALIAPCDGFLSAYRIEQGSVFPIKQSKYSVERLLGEGGAEFDGGLCLVFRLCPEHYHRYHYFDDCTERTHRFLAGKLHTVRPVALERVPVFTENCREVTLLDTLHFGPAAQIEVGAMLVGKIENRHPAGLCRRGEEKGRFLYGGSTVVLLLRRESAQLDEALLTATADGRETPVRLGRRIGHAK